MLSLTSIIEAIKSKTLLRIYLISTSIMSIIILYLLHAFLKTQQFLIAILIYSNN